MGIADRGSAPQPRDLAVRDAEPMLIFCLLAVRPRLGSAKRLIGTSHRCAGRFSILAQNGLARLPTLVTYVVAVVSGRLPGQREPHCPPHLACNARHRPCGRHRHPARPHIDPRLRKGRLIIVRIDPNILPPRRRRLGGILKVVAHGGGIMPLPGDKVKPPRPVVRSPPHRSADLRPMADGTARSYFAHRGPKNPFPQSAHLLQRIGRCGSTASGFRSVSVTASSLG